MNPMRVLVTGAAGAIGEPVCVHLVAEGDFVRAFDRRRSPVGTEVITGELDDAEVVRRAVAGMDALVHLAAHPVDAPFPELIGPNVLGLYHVLDAARSEGVRRVVLASTIQVLRRSDERITDAPRHRGPLNHYALTKVLAEEMGQMYATRFGLEVIAARIGFMVRDVREARVLMERDLFDRYLSRGDAARFCHAAVHAPFEGFAVLHVIGPDGRERFDLDTPRRLVGYEPRDPWPEGLPFPAPAPEENPG